VITIDPGLKAGGLGWEVDLQTHKWLSKRLDAEVEIIPETLARANLPVGCADIVLCISSLEHFSDDDLISTARKLPNVLKPDGIAVMTVDCFLDIYPFTIEQRNMWGRNISVSDFLGEAGLDLRSGNPSELVGFPGFEAQEILRGLPRYHVGRQYPCLAQCFTAVKTMCPNGRVHAKP
jgi:hypothetical protein